jgi:hypothetical protein
MVRYPLLLALALFALTGHVLAREAPAGQAPAGQAPAGQARIVAASPDTEVRFASEKRWRPAEDGMKLQPGDLLSTGYRSMAVLQFDGPAYVLLQRLTQIAIERHSRDKQHVSTRLFLRLGSIRAKVRSKAGVRQQFEIATLTGVTRVGEAEQLVSYAEEFGTRVQMVSGKADARAARNGTTQLTKGETGSLRVGHAVTPLEAYRQAATPDLVALGADDSERDSAREFNRVFNRPLSDATNPNTLGERVSLASSEASMVFRYRVLAGQ